MNIRLIIPVVALFLAVDPGIATAEVFGMRGTRITVEADVHDPDGRPVEGATVHLSFPRYGSGERYEGVSGITGNDGRVELSGIARQDYLIGADKPGYYHTTGPWRAINSETTFQRYAVGVQTIKLELRPIRNPIVGVRKFIDRLKFPAFDVPVGFDLEAGDWVAPHGNGKVADFVFKLEGRYDSFRDYDQKYTLSFSNSGDGIMLVKHPEREGSAFQFPYEAPEAGYEPQRVWHLKWSRSEGGSGSSVDLSGETNYIFRVRTELDENGKVRRAMYGVISGELVPVGGNNEIGRNVSFSYALNPDWTRNLEFGPAGTSRSSL